MTPNQNDRALLVELNRAVGRIEGKVDTALALEPRVSSLEKSKAWVIGAGATCGLLMPVAAYAFKLIG